MPRQRTRDTTQLVDLTTLRAWVEEHIGTEVTVYGTAYQDVHNIAEPRTSLVRSIPLLNAQFGLDVIALANRCMRLLGSERPVRNRYARRHRDSGR